MVAVAAAGFPLSSLSISISPYPFPLLFPHSLNIAWSMLLPIQFTVANRRAKVFHPNILRPLQVGNGASQSQDTLMGPGRESQLFGRLLQ